MRLATGRLWNTTKLVFMPDLRRVRNGHIFAAIVTVLAGTFSGCAGNATPEAAPCADLTGTYENQSSPPGQLLAPFFSGENDQAQRVTLASHEGSRIVASTPNRKIVLSIDSDFVCSADGIRLVRTDTRNIRLPPLIVESEIFHYVFSKASDGSLRMIPHVETRGTSFGMPIRTRQEQQKAEVHWRAVRSVRE
jgi:hypothetical protein